MSDVDSMDRTRQDQAGEQPVGIVQAAEPAQPAAPGKAASFNEQWQDWVTSNIVRGCVDSDLQKVMVDNGFDAQFAQHALQIVRAMTDRVRMSSPATVLNGYTADPIRLRADSNRVRAHDRDVTIDFALSNPNVAVVGGLLSEQECAKLISLSSGRMKTSEVVDRESGGSYQSNVRRSEGCHFERGENAIVQRIEKRIEALSGIPVDHGEPLQMLHYGIGGEYLPHHDYFDPADPGTRKLTEVGGQRVATFVIYLNDVPEGGDTGFPELELIVKPRKGSAVYFEYHNQEGLLDARCLHAGTPVRRGDKWIITKWLRQRPYVSA